MNDLAGKNKIWKGRHGPYLIAEIGGNHEGDFGYAMKLAAQAASSGVDAVKFQIYTGADLVNRRISPDRYQHFRKFELSIDQYARLAKVCREKGAEFIASVWDMDSIDSIDPYLNKYKIGSGDLTAYPIIEKISRTAKPIILSTGLATLKEVLATVSFIKRINPVYKDGKRLALLQCATLYPSPESEINLEAMRLLADKTALTTGYSHHAEDPLALDVAVVMGAGILEFHFTDTREGKVFRDHKVSLTRPDVAALIERIGRIKNIMGRRVKAPTATEMRSGHVRSFRRAVYLKTSIDPGRKLTSRDLVVLRPNNGIDSRDYYKLLGKRLTRKKEALSELNWRDIR